MAGFFSRLKGKDGPTTLTKTKKGQQAASQVLPAKPKWSDAWTRTSVEAEEVQELLKGCTVELKSRGKPSVPYHKTQNYTIPLWTQSAPRYEEIMEC